MRLTTELCEDLASDVFPIMLLGGGGRGGGREVGRKIKSLGRRENNMKSSLNDKAFKEVENKRRTVGAECDSVVSRDCTVIVFCTIALSPICQESNRGHMMQKPETTANWEHLLKKSERNRKAEQSRLRKNIKREIMKDRREKEGTHR